MKKTVYLAEEIHLDAAEKLRAYANVVDTLEPIEELDGILLRAHRLDRDQISRAKKLKVIGRHGVGMDILDLHAAKEFGIPIVYTPMANSNSVAEFAFAMALCLSRNIYQTEAIMKSEGFKVLGPAWLRGREMKGCTVGIVGMGRIGTIVARLFRDAFQSRVLAYDPYLTAEQLAAKGAEKVDTLEKLVSICGIVSINAPLTDETRNMFDAKLFSRFNPEAILLNTARGAIVDEEALYHALAAGKLRAMGTDVYRDETAPGESPLNKLDNFIGFPHVAANTEEAMYRMAMDAVEGMIDVLEGRKPKYLYEY